MGRTERETRRKTEEAVEQAARELHERYEVPIRANPGMKLIEVVNPTDPMALWFTHGLIVETRRVRGLTIALVGLTIVLVVLTAVLALLTLRLASP